MHAIELLEEALRAARAMGYVVREEWLDGAGGGDCEIRGRKHLFVDVSQSVQERLQRVLGVLRSKSELERLGLSTPLSRLLGLHHPGDKAA